MKPAHGPAGQGQARSASAQRLWFQRVLRQHPTLVLSIGYLLLTALGLTYQWVFFMIFRINILDYAEISDFLLAAVRNPTVMLLALAPIPLYWLLRKGTNWLKGRARWYAWLAERTERPGTETPMAVLFVVCYFVLFAMLYAIRVAEPIAAGDGTRVRVEWLGRPGEPATETLLLGSAGAFVFFYDATERRSQVVPIGSISRMVVLRTVRER